LLRYNYKQSAEEISRLTQAIAQLSRNFRRWLRDLMRKVRDQVEDDLCIPAGSRWHRTFVCPAILALFACFLLCPSVPAQPNAKNVLILFHYPAPVVDPAYVDQIESLLRARVPGQVNFYIEHMEATRVQDKDYLQNLTDSLRNTYRGRKLDLVMLSGYPSLDLVIRHRNELFPGVPIVYFSLETRKIAGRTWPGVTGVTETQDVRAVIDLALRLHPDTDTAAIITGKSDEETFWLGELHSELLQHRNKVKEIDLVDLPTDQILQRVDQLPPKTIVFFELQPRESIQPAIGVWDVLARIGQRLPAYCIFPYQCVGHGAVAGIESSGRDEVITLAVSLAARILSGEQVDTIPAVHPSGTQTLADWRQLQRWNIPESALPAGSVIWDRPPSFWDTYRRYVIAVIVVIALLLLLIAGLLWERARKRKAEGRLRESEKRFRVMADTTPSLIWMCDTKGEVIYLNERRVAFTGPEENAGYGDSWTAYVHPDDLRNVKDGMSQGLKDHQAFSREYRLRRYDGVYRWMFDVASPRVNGDGSFAGFIGSSIDTTDQKQAQQALEKVSGQLIEAQEKERSRIARDLHDDICQRLALLSIEIEQANRASSGLSTDTQKNLTEIRQHCAEIAGDVQSLSHQLHSSKLDYLGITAAIRGFCHEFSRQHDVKIDFTDTNVPGQLSKEVSLCLFRVAQEALHNAVKYSGVNQFTVELTATGREIQLVVSDSGTGFDVEAAKRNRGLGLVSMQERVHLVHGMFSVESEPWEGTRIVAVVPLAQESREGQAGPEGRVEEVGPQDYVSSLR
jgi:PAS domain S-box-containing protein